MAGKEKREIDIKVSGSGAEEVKKLTREIAGLNRNVSSISKTVDSVRGAFQGLFAASVLGFGIVEIARLADSMQLLKDRISVLAGPSADVNKIMAGLANTATRTKSSIADLTSTYARLTASSKELGVSSDTLLEITEVLQNTFRISGTSNREATASLVQFTQGLAAGILRGEEFNSVMEQNTELGDILTKSLGKTRGELRELAKEGKLGANVVLKAIIESMDETNAKAAKLGQTFEQSVTIAMNKFTIAIGKANESMGLSSKFATAVNFLIERSEVIGVVLGGLALTTVPLLINAIQALGLAMIAFAAKNPLLLLLTGVSVAIVALVENFDSLNYKIGNMRKSIQEFFVEVNKGSEDFRANVFEFLGADDTAAKIRKQASESYKAFQDEKDRARRAELESDVQAYAKESAALKKAEQERQKLINNGGFKSKGEDKLKELLAQINREYLRGVLSAEKYYEKINEFDLTKITREFRDGKTDLEKYNAKLLELSKVKINRAFTDGAISLQYFNQQVEQVKIAELDNKLQYGTISLREYNAELLKISDKFTVGGVFQVGIQEYMDSLGTTGTAITKAIGNTFGALENEFVDFAITGQATFEKFTESVLKDMARIVYQALILKPILNGIMGYFGGSTAGTSAGSSYTDYSSYAAHGMAFNKGGGVTAFATGGIVNSPTMFNYSGGKRGLMGEAGPEAILPLARGSNGDLGVQASITPVTVNVINQAGVEIQQSESTGADGSKQIDILIKSSIKRAFSDGSMDSTMKANYNVSRAGL